MGCNQSAPDSGLDQQVQREQMAAKASAAEKKKLLLLGAGGSGKSTFFKQLQRIHGTGFSRQERQNYKSKIYEQVIAQMKLLVGKCHELGGDYVERDSGYMVPDMDINNPDFSKLAISVQNQEAAEYFRGIAVTTEMTPQISEMVKALWSDGGIRAAWQIRAQLCAVDSSEYFFNDMDRISAPDYEPLDQDLVYNRYMTTGMNEKEFTINSSKITIVDVGGQRSERRKWIHFFDNVTAIIFVASLSCYDEVLFEDNTQNVMHETLDVFDSTWDSPYFKGTAFILFLNKMDLFAQKINSHSSIRIAFDQYNGPDTVDDSLAYITEVFESRQKSDDTRNIYSHVTTATDKDNVTKVFNDVQHIIINSSLQSSGIL